MFSTVVERSKRRQIDRISIAIARSRGELERAFRLVYTSYANAGLVEPNSSQLRMTPYHFLDTTDVILAKVEDQVVATASVILDGELGLPAESIYDEEIAKLKASGFKLAEVGCLADRRESPVRFIQMFQKMSRLIAQSAHIQGCTGLIAAAHPKHARFYMRRLGFQQFGDIKACPYAQGNPAVALLLDFSAIKGTEVESHLFDPPFPLYEAVPFIWDESVRRHFSSIVMSDDDDLSQKSTFSDVMTGSSLVTMVPNQNRKDRTEPEL